MKGKGMGGRSPGTKESDLGAISKKGKFCNPAGPKLLRTLNAHG